MKAPDNFMRTFKYYKSNEYIPSLDNVLLAKNDCLSDKIKKVAASTNNDERTQSLGLQPLCEWETFYFTNHPGLYFIRNPFTITGQRYWIKKCLEEYPKRPNKKNIDVDTSVEDWWKECSGDEVLMKKLRWTTLGYHHNWDTKIYTEENRTEFPKELAKLSDVVAHYLGYDSFKAEAAIINYYHMKSTLSAHTDHSEVNLNAPLLSFSFGQSAIFLIGGQDKTTTPSAVLLQSGDIMVMSKEARLCYHAVPKILPSETSPWYLDASVASIKNIPKCKNVNNIEELCKEVNNEEWERFNSYVKESRININVRQVLFEGQKSLTDNLQKAA